MHTFSVRILGAKLFFFSIFYYRKEIEEGGEAVVRIKKGEIDLMAEVEKNEWALV